VGPDCNTSIAKDGRVAVSLINGVSLYQKKKKGGGEKGEGKEEEEE